MHKNSVSIILPVYNAGKSLNKTLKSIKTQDYPVDKIIVVDDASTDNSLLIIKKFFLHARSPHIIIHKDNKGLSSSYNDALMCVKTPFVVTWMQDCVVPNNGITELMKPFVYDTSVVATCSKLQFPNISAKKYNFWLRCLYDRNSGKVMSGRNGAFCCFSYKAIKWVGMFDEKRFRTAGEDADLFYKLSNIGNIIDVNITAVHTTHKDDFSVRDLFYKQDQHAEALGAAFFEQSELSLKNMIRILVRPILVFGFFIPHLQTQFLIIIVFYSFFYTKNIYKTDWRNPRIILLPFINIALLFTTTFYFFRGLITQKQQL